MRLNDKSKRAKKKERQNIQNIYTFIKQNLKNTSN